MGALNDEENGGLANTLRDDGKQVAGKMGDTVNNAKGAVDDVKSIKNTVDDIKDFAQNHKSEKENPKSSGKSPNNSGGKPADQAPGQNSQPNPTGQGGKQAGQATKGGSKVAQGTKQGEEAAKKTAETTKKAAEATKQAAETAKETAQATKEAIEAAVDAASEAVHTTARVATDAATLGTAEAVNAPIDVARRTTKGAVKATKKAGEAAQQSAKNAQKAAQKAKEEAQKADKDKFKKFAKKHPMLFLAIASIIVTLMTTQGISYFFLKPFTNSTSTISGEYDSKEGIENPLWGTFVTTQYFGNALVPRIDASDALSLTPSTATWTNPEYPSMVDPSIPATMLTLEGYGNVDFKKSLSDLVYIAQLYIDDTYKEAKADFGEWVEQGRGKRAYCPIPDPIDYSLTWSLFLQQTYNKPSALDVLCAATMKVPKFQTDRTRQLLSELAKHERFKYELLDRNFQHEDMYLDVIYHYPPDQNSQFIWDYRWVSVYDEEGNYVGEEKEWFKRFYAIPEFVSCPSTPNRILKLFEMNPDEAYSEWHGEDLYPPGTPEFDSNLKHYNYVSHIYEAMLRSGNGIYGASRGYSIGALHGSSLTNADIQTYINSAGGISGNRKQILQVALSIVGAVDYEWGGGHGSLNPGWNDDWGSMHFNSLLNRDHVIGLDCTGFVRWVAYTASDQDTMAGMDTSAVTSYIEREISFSELQPGDIGWHRGSGGGHIGIYLGNGSWVHAPGDGQRVSIAESDGPYQFDRFGTIRGSDGNDWDASKYLGAISGTEAIDMSYLIPGPTGIVPSNTSGRRGSEVIDTSNETEMDLLRRVLYAEAYTMGRDGMRLVLDEMINIAIDRGQTLYESLNYGHTYEVVWKTDCPVYVGLPKIINGAADHYDELMDVIMTECNNPILDDKVMYFRTQKYHDGHTDAYVWTKGGKVYFSY